jgi:hypothetical protein
MAANFATAVKPTSSESSLFIPRFIPPFLRAWQIATPLVFEKHPQ